MEETLRCNNLSCRKYITDHGAITTCSHIFCMNCSDELNLAGDRERQQLFCPACKVHLASSNDVVVANLNPTEDYKSSVLNGLAPSVIMECAGRALNFWTYQASQEVVYHEFLAKNSTDNYASLNTQVDKIIHDANVELSDLRGKMSNMALDQENLKRKNEELIQALREKSRKQLQTQELYDKLKRRIMLDQVQVRAGDTADLQASVATDRFVDKLNNQAQQRSFPAPQFLNSSAESMHNPGVSAPGYHNMGPPLARSEGGEAWAGFSNQGAFQQNQPLQTPSVHRQRLAQGNNLSPRTGLPVNRPNNVSGTPMLPRLSTRRSPLANVNGNNLFAGYGMSAGLKVSNPTSAQGMRSVPRSRVAQRPASTFTQSRNPAFGATLNTDNMFSNGEIEDRYY